MKNKLKNNKKPANRPPPTTKDKIDEPALYEPARTKQDASRNL